MLDFLQNEKFYLPIVYVVGGIIVYILVSKTIDKISCINIKYGGVGADKRKNTVIALIKNIIKYLIAIIVIILILGIFGVNTTSLIASLGAVSVIIGLVNEYSSDAILKEVIASIKLIVAAIDFKFAKCLFAQS